MRNSDKFIISRYENPVLSHGDFSGICPTLRNLARIILNIFVFRMEI